MNHEYTEPGSGARRHNGERSPDEIEADLSETRARMEADLAALQDRLSPGYLMDEAMRYVRSGGVAEYFRNLGGMAKRNPMPLALVGTGLAWLAFSGRRGAEDFEGTGRGHADYPRHTDSEYSDYPGTYIPASSDLYAGDEDVDVLVVGDPAASRISEREEVLGEVGTSGSQGAGSSASEAKAKVGEAWDRTAAGVKSAASDVKAEAGQAWDRASGRAGAAVGSAKGKAHDLAEGARHRVESARRGLHDARASARRRAERAREQARHARQSTSQFIHEQPLVAAGIALTVGAILGGLLPSTRRESELLGGKSDEFKRNVKHQAESLAEEGQRRVKTAAESAAEAARRELGSGGSGTGERRQQTAGNLDAPGESAASAGPRSAEPFANQREGQERGGRLSGEAAKEARDVPGPGSGSGSPPP